MAGMEAMSRFRPSAKEGLFNDVEAHDMCVAVYQTYDLDLQLRRRHGKAGQTASVTCAPGR